MGDWKDKLAGLASGTVSAVTVGGGASAYIAARDTRNAVLAQNADAVKVVYYSYASSVSAAAGVRLNPGESRLWEGYTGPVYMIGAASGADVRIDEVG